jgi:hypothetical protein
MQPTPLSSSHNFQKIAEEIKAMAVADQHMRSSGTWDAELDRRHTDRLKILLAEIKWLDRSVVGEEAVHALWLLVQHADHDLVFQESMLKKLSDAVHRGEADARDEAFLIDRVRVNTGRSQVYGTQFYIDPQGVFGPRPIEDVEHLDERRQMAGLEPFDEYRRRLEQRQKEFNT